MDVTDAVERRRAYRALAPVDVSDEAVESLARAASLAPSCFNKQPWRFVFVRSPEMLKAMHGALSEGNEWARAASMLAVVMSRKDLDCVIREREYYLFDTGIAVGQMMLRATEMGLVAHPMAGFSPRKTREALGIPEDMAVMAVIAFGARDGERPAWMGDDDWEEENVRPARLATREFAFMERYPETKEDVR